MYLKKKRSPDEEATNRLFWMKNDVYYKHRELLAVS